MKRQTHLWLMMLVLLLLPTLVQGQQIDQALVQGTLQSQVAMDHNLSPGRLQASDVVQLTFPTTGTVIYTAKLVDPETGATYQAAIDTEGKAVDANAVATQEEKAKVAKYGKIDPQLYDLMSKMESGAVLSDFYRKVTQKGTIPVAIWLAMPATPLAPRPAVT